MTYIFDLKTNICDGQIVLLTSTYNAAFLKRFSGKTSNIRNNNLNGQ